MLNLKPHVNSLSSVDGEDHILIQDLFSNLKIILEISLNFLSKNILEFVNFARLW